MSWADSAKSDEGSRMRGADSSYETLYEADMKHGRPTIAPEKLLRAMLPRLLTCTKN
jgi:hypothetical protein